jgi:hypothetical protein
VLAVTGLVTFAELEKAWKVGAAYPTLAEHDPYME